MFADKQFLDRRKEKVEFLMADFVRYRLEAEYIGMKRFKKIKPPEVPRYIYHPIRYLPENEVVEKYGKA